MVKREFIDRRDNAGNGVEGVQFSFSYNKKEYFLNNTVSHFPEGWKKLKKTLLWFKIDGKEVEVEVFFDGLPEEIINLLPNPLALGHYLYYGIVYCIDCPHHEIKDDFNPLDWMTEDDISVWCQIENKMIANGVHKHIEYKIRAKTEVPVWCSLEDVEPKPIDFFERIKKI